MQGLTKFSITRRIIFIVIGSQLLLITGLTAAALFLASSHLRKALDSELEGNVMSILALARYREVHPPTLKFDSELVPPSPDPTHPDIFEIRLADGSVLARSQKFPERVPQFGKAAEFNWLGVPYRAVALNSAQVLDMEDELKQRDRVTVIYGESLLPLQRNLEELGASIVGAGLLLLAISSTLVTWAVRRRLLPLRELAGQAGTISIRNWSFNAPEEARMVQELAPLTQAIETLLLRLQDSFRQQRDFTSDIAHELKTSVAILKSTLQSLLHRERSGEEYRDGLEHLLEDCGRLEDLLARMLRLARLDQMAEVGGPANAAVTELTSTCESAISRMQAVAGARNIKIELIHPKTNTTFVRAAPEDLELVWVNLLENAVRYSPAGKEIVMRISQNGGAKASISVEDSGPGIPKDDLPHIFERFRRADRSRARSTGGFGLGLAICKAVVTAYGGQIEALSNPAQGTKILVELPLQA